MPERIVLHWDGGAAAALALRQLELEGAYHSECLLTSMGPDGAVAKSGLCRSMLDAQAAALGKRVEAVDVPEPCDQATWEAIFTPVLLPYVRRLVRLVCFPVHGGKPWRREMEHFLISFGMRGVFPIWGKDAAEQCRLFEILGMRAIVTAVDPKRLGEEHLGRPWDPEFVASLPPGVDGMGTDGAFETLCFDGPIFPAPLAFRTGAVVQRGRQRVLELTVQEGVGAADSK